MSSRDEILRRLRQAPNRLGELPPLPAYDEVAVVLERDPAALRARFMAEAQKLSCQVHACESADRALQVVLELIGADRAILGWDPTYIPLPGLAEALDRVGIAIAPPGDASVRVGVTGADAALAGTGGLVLSTGPGRSRLVSLLPYVHVAVITAAQIVPTFEAWLAGQRAAGLQAFRQASTVLVISGPSRTADIAMTTVMPAHGPAEVQIVLLP